MRPSTTARGATFQPWVGAAARLQRLPANRRPRVFSLVGADGCRCHEPPEQRGDGRVRFLSLAAAATRRRGGRRGGWERAARSGASAAIEGGKKGARGAQSAMASVRIGSCQEASLRCPPFLTSVSETERLLSGVSDRVTGHLQAGLGRSTGLTDLRGAAEQLIARRWRRVICAFRSFIVLPVI